MVPPIGHQHVTASESLRRTSVILHGLVLALSIGGFNGQIPGLVEVCRSATTLAAERPKNPTGSVHLADLKYKFKFKISTKFNSVKYEVSTFWRK